MYGEIVKTGGMSDATPIPRAKRESVVPGMEEAVSTNQQTMQRFK